MSVIKRLPSMYVCHGGGPFPIFAPEKQGAGGIQLTEFLQSIPKLVPTKPRAILIVSAHFTENEGVTITSGENPELLFDYYGFPRPTYKYKYPASGDPALALNIASKLQAQGIKCSPDKDAKWDHGVFVPLLLAYPNAEIPVVSLSLNASLDTTLHYKIGEILEPLREEGVLLIASGMSFHNMSAFSFQDNGAELKGEAFDTDLRAACLVNNKSERKQLLINWEKFRQARFAHPTSEHLIPLMVASGAAGNDKARVVYSGSFAGSKISCFMFT